MSRPTPVRERRKTMVFQWVVLPSVAAVSVFFLYLGWQRG